jgi:hypothetical protein
VLQTLSANTVWMCWIAKLSPHSREIHGVSGRVLARLSRPHDEGAEAFFALDGVGHPLDTQLVPALDGLFYFLKHPIIHIS